jgi:integrase
MGRAHVKDGILTITQKKGGHVTEVDIPIFPALAEVLDEVQRRRITPTFIVTAYGQSRSEAGFTNKFRDWFDAAGLPKGLSPDGLRKAFCRVAAEAGLTPHQIMSITGHKTLTEVTRYTAAADQEETCDRRDAKDRKGNGVWKPQNLGFPISLKSRMKGET